MIEAAEGAGTRCRRDMRLGAAERGHGMSKARMLEARMLEPGMLEARMAEAMGEGRAAREPWMVVEGDRAVAPVETPVMPAPAVMREKTDAQAQSEVKARSAVVGTRHADPVRVGKERCAVREPRIVGRHVHDLRIRWLDDDRLALCRDRLLRCALQRTRRLRASAQRLDRLHHLACLAGIGLTERRGPRQVLAHVVEYRRERRQRLDARVPRLLIDR